jgi:hypothetical protein
MYHSPKKKKETTRGTIMSRGAIKAPIAIIISELFHFVD